MPRAKIGARVALACALMVGASGCYGAQIRSLEQGVYEAHQANERLERRAEAVEARAAAVEATAERAMVAMRAGTVEIHEIKTLWEQFARDYSPELRARLDENLDRSAVALATLERHLADGEAALRSIRGDEAAARGLRETTARHEAEARASNVVETLRRERGEMIALAQGAESHAAGAAGSADAARYAADQARAHAAQAGHAASDSAQHAASANHAANAVGSEIAHLASCLARLDDSVDHLERRVRGTERAIGDLSRQTCSCRTVHARR